jgi:hypothetical protein
MSFKKIAQAAPPAPDMGGMGAPPAPDLGGMGGGMDLGLGAAPMAGGAPAPPAAPVGPTPPSKFPLDSVNAIIKDADISQKIMGGNDIGDVVDEIWMMYGGQEYAGSRSDCVGERMPFKEASDDEIEATLNERWKRLPVGETLTSLGIEKDDMFEAVQNYSFGFSKSKNQPAQPAGGGMGLASLKLDNMIKTAFLLDQKGEYRKADEIFNNI